MTNQILNELNDYLLSCQYIWGGLLRAWEGVSYKE